MPLATRALAFNAVCLYVIAYLLTIVLHEGGHAAMALALGDHPVLYSTSVRTTSAHLTNLDHVLIAAAGPVLSLGQGLLLLGWLRQRRPRSSWGLFGLYMGLFGLINFLGYLLIAPFVAGGDTGQIVARLHVPAAAVWVVAALALATLVLAIGRTGPLLLGVLPVAEQASPEARTGGLRALVLWPWLLGSVALVLLALPAPHPAVVANMVMSPMVLRRAYATGQRAPVQPTGALGLPRPQWLLGAVLVLVAIGFRWLALGVAL
ncbi:hypothetical protein HHL22_11095 [Hymenobacter sp. RP-2-7]|uniref:M50 family peptidase n=1 Tax=Hymenobacter polaris TaxID=2682546 RepID=A0A7Y0AEB5_9BACT|nr:hypothetical protein [Hymenobacter polaris]NML65752.1 hypothetical protein [Hymenobacter polaris]